MSTNNGPSQLIAQWITSLAISVICCAVLFVVFAGYIVDLQGKINLATVRLEVYQEKNNQLYSEITYVRRLFQQHAATPPTPSAEPSQAAVQPDHPSSSGVEISEPAPIEPNVQGEMNPVVVPMPGKEVARPVEARKPSAPKTVTPAPGKPLSSAIPSAVPSSAPLQTLPPSDKTLSPAHD